MTPKNLLLQMTYWPMHIFFIFMYKVEAKRIRKKRVKKKYKVAVCAIFKNEALYMREWIEYHRIVGVEHFYLYNNNSDDDYKTVLNDYIETGLVTLIQWKENHAQNKAYKNCIQKFRKYANWIGFIDLDEFIVPKSKDNIYNFLKKFENSRGAVLIYWRIFGTSGRVDRDTSGLVTEDFTVCWPQYYATGKCFYNTAFDCDLEDTHNQILNHSLWVKGGNIALPPVNIYGRLVHANYHYILEDDLPIQINHYFTRTYLEFEKKKERGDAFFQTNPHDEAYFFEHEMKCTSTDYSSYKYLIKLKLAMGRSSEKICIEGN